MSDKIKRGENLLKPYGLALEDVQAVSLSRKKFDNAATARQFVKMHGMNSSKMTPTAHHFIFEVSPLSQFEPESMRIERINHDTFVSAGVRRTSATQDFDLDIEVEAPETVETVSPSLEVIAQVGDLFNLSKRSDETESSETAPVRTIGIVLKADDPDSQGSLISAEEIEKANLEFMRDFGTVGLMHQSSLAKRVFIVQNVIAHDDLMFELADGVKKIVKKGTWYQEHYTADPEIAGKIRRGELTGLSIGGLAKKVSIEKRDAVCKSADGLSQISKGTATHRLVELSVQEVSLVDVAANEERFLVIRRKNDQMDVGQIESAVATPAASKEEEMSVNSPVADAGATPETPNSEVVVKADEVVTTPVAPAAEVAAVAPVEPTNVPTVDISEVVAESVRKAVEAALAPISEKLLSFEKQLEVQAEAVQKSAVMIATAKGESTPSQTHEVQKAEQNKSLWAGSVVHRVGKKGK